MFEFKETTALNGNFELFGIDSKDFIMNSGSFFILLLLIGVYNILSAIIHKIATKNPKRKFCRMLGMRFYSKSHLKDFSIESMKLFLETHFDMNIACL
jgi:hypothetical protein